MGLHGRNGRFGQITRAVPSPPVSLATSAVPGDECSQVRSWPRVCLYALRGVKAGRARPPGHRSYNKGRMIEKPAHMMSANGTPALRKSLAL